MDSQFTMFTRGLAQVSQLCLGLVSRLCLVSAGSRDGVAAGEGVSRGSARAVTGGPMGGNGANGANGATGAKETSPVPDVGVGVVSPVSTGAAGAAGATIGCATGATALGALEEEGGIFLSLTGVDVSPVVEGAATGCPEEADGAKGASSSETAFSSSQIEGQRQVRSKSNFARKDPVST